MAALDIHLNARDSEQDTFASSFPVKYQLAIPNLFLYIFFFLEIEMKNVSKLQEFIINFSSISIYSAYIESTCPARAAFL